MQAVILTGLQGAGKSSFFQERFFHSHVRISLDLLKTRYRERRLLELCLATDQPFVVDNTNPTRAERSIYITAARAVRFTVTGYYLQSQVEACLSRNASRDESQRVPEVGILATAKKLELPTLSEGFDQLYYVRMQGGRFVVEDWKNEV